MPFWYNFLFEENLWGQFRSADMPPEMLRHPKPTLRDEYAGHRYYLREERRVEKGVQDQDCRILSGRRNLRLTTDKNR